MSRLNNGKSHTFKLMRPEWAMITSVARAMGRATGFPSEGRSKFSRTKALITLFYDKYVELNGEAPPNVTRPEPPKDEGA